ncbi:hypothetical protein ABPG72_012296 [Tetrahymena utriculariae]
MINLKNYHEEFYQSPKSLDIDSESKIRNGAASRGRLFYEFDQTPFQRKIDLQESLYWSDKNSSISVSKTAINMNQYNNQHNEFDTFSKPQIMELEVNYQNKTASKSNLTIFNPNQLTSQQQIVQNQNPNNKIQDIKAINTQKSFNLQGEKKEQQSPLPERDQKQQRAQMTIRNFRVMLLAKKFQKILLNKSQSYVFRKTLDDRYSFQLLADKAFVWEDFKREIALKFSRNKKLLKLQFLVSDIISYISIIWTINPFSTTKFIFDVFTFIVIFINIAYLPIKHAYHEIFNLFQEGIVEKITLYFLLLEVFVNMSTQFYSRGLLVKDQFRVFKNYLQGRLWIDLIVGIPYLLSQLHSNLSILNLFYLIRFLDFLIIFNKIDDKFLKNSHFGDAVKCIFLIFFVAHLSACIIYEISTLPKPDLEKTYLDSIDVDRTQWLQVYIYSFYWSIITMTTIGYGDIHPYSYRERVYASFFAIISCVVFGFTLNQIGSIMSNLYMNSNMVRKKLAIIESYLKKRNVSPDLQVKVKKNIEYILTDSDQQDKVVEEMLNSLTISLRSQLKVELYKNILKTIQAFQINFSDSFLSDLCNLFQEQTYSQEQYLYYEGDYPDRFYFVIRGEIELYYQQNKCPCTIQKRESLGIEEFFSQQCRVQSAKASRVTTVAYICYEDFCVLLKKYQLDLEKYRMMYDSVNLNRQTVRLFVRCQNCQGISHVTSDCPYLFYIKNYKKSTLNAIIQDSKNPQIHTQRQKLDKKRSLKKFNSKRQQAYVWKKLFEYLYKNIDMVVQYYDDLVDLQNNSQQDSQDEDEDDENDVDHENENNGQEQKDQQGEEHQKIKQTATALYSDKNGENTPYKAIVMFKSQHMNKQNNTLSTQANTEFSDKQKEQLAKFFFSQQNKSNSAIDFYNLDQFYQPPSQQGQENKDNQQNRPFIIQNMFDVSQKKDPNQQNIFQEQQRDTHLQYDGKLTPTNADQKNLLTVNHYLSKDNTSFSFAQQSSFQKEEQDNQNQQQIRLHQNSSNLSDNSNITFMNMNQMLNSNLNQINYIMNSPQIDPKTQNVALNIPALNLDQNKKQDEHIQSKSKTSTEINQNNNNAIYVSNINPSVSHNNQQPQSHPEIQKIESNFTNLQGISKSLSNINSLSNQNSNTPQQSSAVDTFKRKSSYFSGYNKRKTSEIKRDDQSHSKLLMPVTNNQFTATVDDSYPSHQIPHGTSNNISLLNYNEAKDNKATYSNNLNPSSGQSNINLMSNLLLEPISPIKQQTKQENTSPMLTINKEIFTHSELQFDIQSDQLSPRNRKQLQLLEKQNHQSPANKLIQPYQIQNSYDKDGKKRQNPIQPSYTNLDECFYPQNSQNRSQQNALNSDNNTVSIRLDDQDQQQQFQDKSIEQTRYQILYENSSRGQSTRQLSIRKGSHKNNTLLMFGQQPPEIEQQNSLQQTQQSAKNYEENYNTSQSYLQNYNLPETTNDYHPSQQGRKKSSKTTQNELWNEKINSLQNDYKKELMQNYLQNNRSSQRNIRSQRNIEIQSRKNKRDDSITKTQIQQLQSEMLIQSQEYPKEGLPGLYKNQSAKVKVPIVIHPQSSFQIQQMQLQDQKIHNNKKLLLETLNHKNQSLSTIKQNTNHRSSSHQTRQHTIIKSGEHQPIDSLEPTNNQSFDNRTQRFERKFTNKKISFKITEDTNMPRDNQRNHTISSNSLIQTQTLAPQYKLMDDEHNSEEDQYKFSLILEFDCMKQYNAYFPWNNYSNVIKPKYGFKKKKKNEMTLFGTKQMTKVVRTKALTKIERDNSSANISKTQIK